MISNRPIDLRSDTITRPTPEMRKAMHDAEVGDDYYHSDPTVKALEEKTAEMLGKEAALLVLSGTMGNLVSILAQTTPGQSVILGDNSHILMNEAGGLSALGGLLPRPVPAPGGVISAQAAQSAMLVGRPLNALTSMICLENTHNAAGGRVVQAEAIKETCAFARAHGLKVHVDGARLFNAAVASGRPASELVCEIDSVTFCLTKGLGCPVGSMVAGDADFIEEARHKRQLVGGGMRQAGVWAAAGLVALDVMIERLSEDHEHARRLAELLADAGLPCNPEEVETNMVFFEVPENVMPAADFVARLSAGGVTINPPKGKRVRFVTHAEVDRKDVEQAARVVRDVVTETDRP